MKVKELIEKLKKCDQELDINTFRDQFNPDDCDTTNYWVIDVQEYPKGSSGYENDGEVLLITSE